jgi:hypothetical protein
MTLRLQESHIITCSLKNNEQNGGIYDKNIQNQIFFILK